MRLILFVLPIFCLVFPVGAVLAEDTGYSDLSIEELVEVPIFSASRRQESLVRTTAAAFVLNKNDIQRSGVTSIPEALRLIPGVLVQRIDSSSWAVSIRGFGYKYSNKLLVLIDGRSIYNTGFTGVYWDMHDLLLDDVESIEVIRGPGGAFWGANAVNGVINIITKSAFDSKGSFIDVGGGNEDQFAFGMRYGALLDEETSFRISSKVNLRDDLPYIDQRQRERESLNPSRPNEWNSSSFGFRLDRTVAESLYTLQGYSTFVGGDGSGASVVSESLADKAILGPRIDSISALTAALRGRWKRDFENGASTLQSFISMEDRTDSRGLTQKIGTANFDYQFEEKVSIHRILSGLSYSYKRDETESAFPEVLIADPVKRDLNYGFAFLQDSVSLLDDALTVSVGAKVTYNPFSRFDFQPSLRVGHSFEDGSFAWGAVSRAVRVPSRLEAETRIAVAQDFQGPLSVIGVLEPPQRPYEEKLIAYELGYRFQPHESANLDVALFYNDYQDLERLVQKGELQPGSFGGFPTLYVVGQPGFDTKATSFGGEVVLDWKAGSFVRLQLSYSYLNLDFDVPELAPNELTAYLFQNGAPHSGVLRTIWTLPGDMELDGVLRYSDVTRSLPRYDGLVRATPAILQMDVRFAWHPTAHWDFSVAGQNLLNNRPEYNDGNDYAYAATSQKAVIGRVRYNF